MRNRETCEHGQLAGQCTECQKSTAGRVTWRECARALSTSHHNGRG